MSEKVVGNGLAGRPSLEQQAINKHRDGKTRTDLEMGKLVPRAMKQFLKLFKRMEAGDKDIKVNQELQILEKVFKHSKDFNEAFALAQEQFEKEEYEEEDDEIRIELTSSETESQRLN